MIRSVRSRSLGAVDYVAERRVTAWETVFGRKIWTVIHLTTPKLWLGDWCEKQKQNNTKKIGKKKKRNNRKQSDKIYENEEQTNKQTLESVSEFLSITCSG